MKSKITSILFGSALVAMGMVVSASSANAAIIVPGTADIWAWNGIISPNDEQTPPGVVDISPTLALGSLTGIHSVTISYSGETGHCPGCDGIGPLANHLDGTVNGVPDLTAHLDSLIGAWINLTDNSLSQSFEITSGDTYIVPTGADELFLGSMDGYQWNNNEGEFVVSLETHRNVPEPFTLSLFGAGLAGAAAMRRRKKA
jgi:hypothetical protein